MKLLSLLLIWCSLPVLLLAQNPQTVRLKQALALTTTDTSQILALAEVSASYRYSRPDSALWYAQRGEKMAQRIRYAKGESRCLTQIGFVLSEKGDLASSLRELLHAEELSRLADDPEGLAQTLQNIGYLYVSFPDYRQAKAYLFQAKAIYAQHPIHTSDAILVLANLGYAYRYENRLDSARYYQQMAYRQAGQLPPSNRSAWGDPLPFILRELGAIATKAGETAGGIQYLHQAAAAALADNNKQVYTRTCNTLATLFRQQHQPDSAIWYARQALVVAQQTGLAVGVLKNSQQLALLYKTSRQADSALKYTELMMSANDSLYNQQRIKQLEAVNFTEIQRRRRLEGEKARFESQVLLYSQMAGVLVLGISLLFVWRNYRRQRQANALLTTLNEQVHVQKAEITHQRDDLSKTLTDLRTTQNQLVQAEKMASLGELTAGIAHEIQNPLNFVNNFAEVSVELLSELQEGPLQKLPDSEKEYADELLGDLTQNLQKITQHGNRASSIVKGMLEHSRTTTGERQPTNLNALADEYLRLSYHGLRAKDKDFNATLVTDFAQNLDLVNVVPQDIGRVLLNLYNNAFYAVHEKQKSGSEGYKPTIHVSTAHTESGVEIRISDNGTGMSEATKAKIFQPFFTTKPSGSGTGLGLSLAYDIVTKGHGGKLEVESVEGEGTTFVIQLPA